MGAPTRDVIVRPQAPPPVRHAPAGKAAIWAAAKWWEHRVPLAPINASAATLAGAGILHAAPGIAAPSLMLLGTGLGGAGTWHWVWRRRNNRALTRLQTVFNTACGTFVFGFEAAAVSTSPASAPMLRTLLAATAAASASWWMRAAAAPEAGETTEDEAADETADAAAPAEEGPGAAEIWARRIGAANGPIANSTLTRVKPLAGPDGKPNGQTGIITLNADGGPIRHTAGDVTPQLPKVATAYDMRVANVAVEPLSSSKLTLLLFAKNPLAQPVLWPGPGEPGTFRHPAAMTPTGKWVHQQLVVPGWGAVHELIVGSTGSGKSRTARLRLAMARHSFNKNGEPSAASWLLDPHEGASFAGWKDRVDVFAHGDHQILAALAALIAEKNRRLKILSNSGREVLRPSPMLPHIRAVLDEAPGFLQRCPQAAKMIAELVAEGRKVIVGLTVLTQYPTADKLGNDVSIRDGLLTSATVHRTGNSFTGMIVANGKQIGDPGALPLIWADGTSAAGVAYYLGTDADHSVMVRSAVGGLDIPYDEDDDNAPAPPPYDESWFQYGPTVRTEAGIELSAYLAANPDGAPQEAVEAGTPASQPQWAAAAQASAASAGSSTMWDRINLYLSEVGEEATTTQICTGIGEDPQAKLGAVSQACSRAVDAGKLIKTGHGSWTLPQRSSR